MNKSIQIGNRRELFADGFLIESLDNLEHTLHEPAIASDGEILLNAGYVTVIEDDEGYKRYYRINPGENYYDGHPDEITCLDTSKDGIHWEEPDLGIFPENGGKKNIILAKDPPRNHNFAPFLDVNPDAPPEDRYKALSGTHKDDGGRPDTVPPLPEIDSGLYAFTSPDGIHWKKMVDYPVITFPEYAFDSQNIAFWSEVEECYVCYFRCWEDTDEEKRKTGVKRRVTQKTHLRSIARTTSGDFINWTTPIRLNPNFPEEHLYTSQIHPYYRAPHIYISLPTRFMPSRGSSTDIMFMTARPEYNGKFDRTFTGAFVKPGPDPAAWGNRSNYANAGIYQTSSTEISFYVRGIRRVLRIDGFASVHSFSEGGTLITKPFVFEGSRLFLNYATSAAGSIIVSFLDVWGKPIPGFTKEDSIELVGDEIDGEVPFKESAGPASLSGTPVCMRVDMEEADLFSFQFR